MNNSQKRASFVPLYIFIRKPAAYMLVFLLVLIITFGPLSTAFAEKAIPAAATEATLQIAPQTKTDSKKEPIQTTAPVENKKTPPKEELLPKEIIPKEKTIEDKVMQAAAAASAPAPIKSLSDTGSSSKTKLVPGVDNLSGALVYEYEINVPLGRNQMAPDVSLVYNSATATTDSVVGAGWSINIPSIERINKKGSNKLYTENYYSSSLDGELVSTGTGTYAAKVENGNFLKYTLSNNVWTVTDKEGTVYKFGNTGGARQDDSANTSKVFKWMLEEERDINNNYISYQYFKDEGQIYPLKITYTGNGSTAGIFTVNFVTSSRTNGPTSFATGFSVKSNYRITEIRTEVNGAWARKYALVYTTGDNGSGSLLDTIVKSGQDESSVVTTLPAVDFDYQTSTSGWTYTSSWNPPIPFIAPGGVDIGARLADINGDGLPDLVCHNYNKNSGWPCDRDHPYVFLNNGSGWTDVSSTWLFPYMGGSSVNGREYFTTDVGADTGLRVADINGDGLADLVRVNINNSNTYINNGSGWTYTPSWNPPNDVTFFYNGDTGARITDINGDGLPDIICHNSTKKLGKPCDETHPTIFLNTGSGWTDVSATWLFPYVGGSSVNGRESFTTDVSSDSGLRVLDVNGDGLADLVRSDGGTTYAYLNSGSGWTYNSTWTYNIANRWGIQLTSGGLDTGARLADINDDGLPDFICRNGKASTGTCDSTHPVVFLNNGDSTWSNISSTWLFPLVGGAGPSREAFLYTTGGTDYGLRLLDINGDGLTDLIKGGDGNLYTYLNNGNTQANLLTKITYAQGGNTQITYKATPLFKDASNKLLNPKLPIAMDVVSQITTSDGLGTTEGHTYQYEGGEYYFNTPLLRKLAGFAKITDTDSGGNVKKTYYHQGNSTNTALGEYDDNVSKIGKAYRLEEYDSSGKLFNLTIDKIDKYNIGADHDFVKTVRRTTLNYDGNASHADTASEYSYNTSGNLIEAIDWGEVTANTDGSFTDKGTDKSTETIRYAANVINYVIGLPYQDTVVEQSGSGNKVRESKIYYDNLSLGQVLTGNSTKAEDWVTGNTYINNQKAYNTYGLPTSSTDPRGNVTSYTYDSYNLYPKTVTNPLSHATNYIYDYSLGKPKQVTDPNNFVYQTIYDGLDRVKEEKVPSLTSPYTPVTKTTYIYTDTLGAIKVKRTDYLDDSNSKDTYQYFDGLGRLIQERKVAEGSGAFNVRDIAYNNRGMILKESLPYTSSGSAKTLAIGDAALYTNYIYDPLNRPLAVVNILGTTSYMYDDLMTTTTDAEGNVKNYYKDARGNLVKVDEINDGSTYTTNYEWNLLGKLTKITDALSNVRNFTYDGLGRRLTAEDLHASGDDTFGVWSYTYDEAGNLTETMSPNALITDYSYNNINQVLTEDYTGVAGTEVIYSYGGCANGIEKLCSVAMTSGANTAFTYDSNGNIASEAKTINSTAYTTSYSYDRQGNQITITNPDSSIVKYNYNSAGMLEAIQRKESGSPYTNVVTNFDYSPTGQTTVINYATTAAAGQAGSITTNTYDPAKLYRLTHKVTTIAGSLHAQDLTYTYDKVGNIIKIVDASNTDTAKTANYTYDNLYRLTGATISNVASGQSTYTQSFTYDAIGNILTGPAGAYLYAGTGYANPQAVTSIGGVNYTYDKNGNLLTKGIELTNTWDYNNRLIEAITPSSTSVYTYDQSGQRIMSANTSYSAATPAPTPALPTPGTFMAIQTSANSSASTIPTIIFAGGTDAIGEDNNGVAASATITIPAGILSDAADHSITIDSVLIDLGSIALSPDQVAAIIAANPFADKDYTVTNPSGADIHFQKNIAGTQGNVALSMEDASYGTAKVETVTFTPLSVNAGDTFRATINDINYDYIAKTGDTVASITLALAPLLDASPLASCSEDQAKITCVAESTTFTFDATVLSAVPTPPATPPNTNTTVTTVYPNKLYNTNGTKQTEQIYAGDQLVATIETVEGVTTPYYVHTDHLNSTNVTSDDAGTLVETLDYFPYGAQRISSGTHTAQRQYIGQMYDVDTELSYLNARYYDGVRGQFLSQDPVFLNPEGQGKEIFEIFLKDPQTQNSYSYARNNPISLSDPTGKSWLTAAEGFSTYLAVSAIITAYIIAAPVTIPATVLATVAVGGLGAVGYGTYSNYQAYTSGQISKDQFDYNAGGLLGGIVPIGGLSNFTKSAIPDEALVVRGGLNTESNWNEAAGAIKNSNGTLNCVSANCAAGKTVEELSVGIKNKMIGVSTAGEIRSSGGTVKSTPSNTNPYHIDINGLNPKQGSKLFTPTIKNPNKIK